MLTIASNSSFLSVVCFYILKIFKKKIFIITSCDVIKHQFFYSLNSNFIFFNSNKFFFFNCIYINYKIFLFFIKHFLLYPFILFDFKHYIKNYILKLNNILNIHPSLVPNYLGSSPIFYHLLNGKKYSGISVILITDLLDIGNIFDQFIIKTNYNDNIILFKKKVNFLILILIIKFLNNIYYNQCFFYKKIKIYKQIFYTKKIKKIFSLFKLNYSAYYLECQYRAYYDWPGSFFYYNNMLVKVCLLIFYEKKNFLYQKSCFLLKTHIGYINILKIQFSKKKIISIYDHINSNIISSIN